jgi:hypothetical protein
MRWRLWTRRWPNSKENAKINRKIFKIKEKEEKS